jgi:hypothetical protein
MSGIGALQGPDLRPFARSIQSYCRDWVNTQWGAGWFRRRAEAPPERGFHEWTDPEAAAASGNLKTRRQSPRVPVFGTVPVIAHDGRSPRAAGTRTCARGKTHARLTPPLFACRPPMRSDGEIMRAVLRVGISLALPSFPTCDPPPPNLPLKGEGSGRWIGEMVPHTQYVPPPSGGARWGWEPAALKPIGHRSTLNRSATAP